MSLTEMKRKPAPRGRRRYSDEEERRIWDAMTEEERKEYSALSMGADIAVANLAAMRAIRNTAMERMAGVDRFARGPEFKVLGGSCAAVCKCV